MSSNDNNEQQFKIQPHPAKTDEETGGLQTSQGAFSAYKANPGPQIPTTGQMASLEQPLGREELEKRQVEINKWSQIYKAE